MISETVDWLEEIGTLIRRDRVRLLIRCFFLKENLRRRQDRSAGLPKVTTRSLIAALQQQLAQVFQSGASIGSCYLIDSCRWILSC